MTSETPSSSTSFIDLWTQHPLAFMKFERAEYSYTDMQQSNWNVSYEAYHESVGKVPVALQFKGASLNKAPPRVQNLLFFFASNKVLLWIVIIFYWCLN